MAEGTLRDQIWSVALNRAIRKDEPVRPKEIAEHVGVSEKTAGDCLRSISGANLLRRDFTNKGELRYLPPKDIEKK